LRHSYALDCFSIQDEAVSGIPNNPSLEYDSGFHRLLRRIASTSTQLPKLEIEEGSSVSATDDSEIGGSLVVLPAVNIDGLPEVKSGGGGGGGRGDQVDVLTGALLHPGKGSRWVSLESLPSPRQFPEQVIFERLVDGMGDRRFKQRVACYQSLIKASDDALPSIAKALRTPDEKGLLSLEQLKRLETILHMIVGSGLADPYAIEDPDERRAALENNASLLRDLADPCKRERRMETLRRIGLLYREGLLPLDSETKKKLESEYRVIEDPALLSLRFSRERLEMASLIISRSGKRDEVFRLLLDSVESSPEIIEECRFARLVRAADLEHAFEKLFEQRSGVGYRITDKSLAEFRKWLDYTGNEVGDEGRRVEPAVADP